MKNFLLVTNPSKDKGLLVTEQIRNYVKEKGGTCVVVESRESGEESVILQPDQFAIRPEVALILGGDGTFIKAARDLEALQIPMIGISMGTLGYLCEIEQENLIPSLERIMQDDFIVENRLALAGEAILNDEEQPVHTALNDIVIHRYGIAQVVNLNLYVNGKFLCNYSADGVVISTPTGSSAYNLSAGGPIVDPKTDVILVTPICPQGMVVKSMVIDPSDEITVEMLERNHSTRNKEGVEVSFDGDYSTVLSVGDRIVIRRAKGHVQIMKLSEMSFIERMHKKMDHQLDR